MRHAVVTGASSGIGAAVAARLLAEGWRVTALGRTAPAAHPMLEHRVADLADTAAIRPALAGLAPDALVHAAGLMRGGVLGALDGAASDTLWRLHVAAAEALADALAPSLPDGSGRIVLIGSRAAAGGAGRSQYAATKAALVAMARSWAAELAPRGVTCNVVAPAATDTPMLRDPARAGTPTKLPPIGRYVRPGEVAAAVAFLLGAEAGAITGQQLVICGGSSL